MLFHGYHCTRSVALDSCCESCPFIETSGIILLLKQNFLLHVEFTVDDYNLSVGIALKADFSAPYQKVQHDILSFFHIGCLFQFYNNFISDYICYMYIIYMSWYFEDRHRAIAMY